MAVFVRIQVYTLTSQSVLELDVGEQIIGTSSDGHRVAVVTAKDVTAERASSPPMLRPVDAG